VGRWIAQKREKLDKARMPKNSTCQSADNRGKGRGGRQRAAVWTTSEKRDENVGGSLRAIAIKVVRD